MVGTIAPNISIPVTFSVTVVALPTSGHVQNQATSRYTINGEEQISTSNITFTEVISANIIAVKQHLSNMLTYKPLSLTQFPSQTMGIYKWKTLSLQISSQQIQTL